MVVVDAITFGKRVARVVRVTGGGLPLVHRHRAITRLTVVSSTTNCNYTGLSCGKSVTGNSAWSVYNFEALKSEVRKVNLVEVLNAKFSLVILNNANYELRLDLSGMVGCRYLGVNNRSVGIVKCTPDNTPVVRM